ncbi:unnamed protein product [Mycena citricolor]|uniref:Glycosyltransferase family 49 protein n=1 Tax=Mycena citricolor TaxID=2018698 RepID=A0AAD2HWH3_9AGAR|nr:unnamed protein product [Mycena citricolor]
MFLLRVFKICSALYLFAAVLHTTSQLFSSPVHAGISLLAKCRFPSLVASSFQSLLVKRTASKNIQFVPQDQISLQSRTSQEIVLWTSSPFALENGLGHSDPIPMSEDLFLSKAFSSLRPSKIIPFFYRRTGSFEADDITITTLVTSNRLQVFARLVERYSGPISVTIHIKNSSENVYELLDSIHSVYTSTPKMSSNVDVHLVVDAFDRQFNTWRNIARFFARTDFVMMLDIDFSPCTDFRSAIRSSSAMMEKLRTGTAAFVVPAFEYPKHEDGIDAARFPQTKTELIAQVDSGKITVFHAFWGPGHSSTHYERYYASSPGEVYRVDSYQAAYEPYVIFKKDGPPWQAHIFVGTWL